MVPLHIPSMTVKPNKPPALDALPEPSSAAPFREEEPLAFRTCEHVLLSPHLPWGTPTEAAWASFSKSHSQKSYPFFALHHTAGGQIFSPSFSVAVVVLVKFTLLPFFCVVFFSMASCCIPLPCITGHATPLRLAPSPTRKATGRPPDPLWQQWQCFPWANASAHWGYSVAGFMDTNLAMA